MLNNPWKIEGDTLIRNRGGFGRYNPNAIYERIENLLEVNKPRMNKFKDLKEFRKAGQKVKRDAVRKVAIEFDFKYDTILKTHCIVKSNRKLA